MKNIRILLEAQDYESMFNFVLPYLENNLIQSYLVNYKQEIEWAKTHLKKLDRIIWYLKHVKYGYVKYIVTLETPETLSKLKNKLIRDKQQLENDGFGEIITNNDKRNLEHFISLSDVGKIQNYKFSNQSVSEIITAFTGFENEWKKNTRPSAVIQPDDKIVIQFKDNSAWWLLPRSGCDDEASAGGHCGNVPSAKSGQRILSFRTKNKEGNWTVLMTFILWENGYLGEMKGAHNQKPLPKFYPYIIELLKNKKLIKGIRGGGYRPEMNFEFSDLSDAQKKEVFSANPDLDVYGGYLAPLLKKYGPTPEIISKIEYKIDESQLPEIHEIKADTQEAILKQWDNFEEFADDISFDYLKNAAEAADKEELDDSEMETLSYDMKFSPDEYLRVIERLPDEYLQKIANDLNIRKNISSYLVKEEISENIVNSKYHRDLVYAMIKSSQIKNIKNEKGFSEYIELLMKLVYRANRNYQIGINYDVSNMQSPISISMSLDNFVEVLDESFNDSDSYEDEEAYMLASDVMSNQDWYKIDKYELKSDIKSLSNKKSYGDFDEDEINLFNKFKSVKASDNDTDPSNFTISPEWASRYFMREVQYNESEENNKKIITQLKKLSGIW